MGKIKNKLVINRLLSGISGKCNFKYRVKKNMIIIKGIEIVDNLRYKWFRFMVRERIKFLVFFFSCGCVKYWKE